MNIRKEELRAQVIYFGAWALGIVAAFFAMVLLAWLLTPTTEPGTLDDVYCVDHPSKPVTDEDIQAWIDSGGEYQQPGGPHCYYK